MTRHRRLHGPLLAGLAAALLLGACDRINRSLKLTGNVADVVPQIIGPARLRVTIPATGAVAVLGPVARNGDVTVWQTLDGITLSFREGVLIATRGLGDDLMSADVAGDIAVLRGQGGAGYHPQLRSYLDGENMTVFRGFQCRRDAQSTEQVTVAGQSLAARRIDIACVSPDQAFAARYWLDGQGQVIRSRQWISPTLQYMETEIVVR